MSKKSSMRVPAVRHRSETSAAWFAAWWVAANSRSPVVRSLASLPYRVRLLSVSGGLVLRLFQAAIRGKPQPPALLRQRQMACSGTRSDLQTCATPAPASLCFTHLAGDLPRLPASYRRDGAPEESLCSPGRVLGPGALDVAMPSSLDRRAMSEDTISMLIDIVSKTSPSEGQRMQCAR